ncbi:MAG TPA: PRC-barrel domain-containing protein [Ktedonobacterales bacterium]|nr:PRC-barrel domain-containing protein [Ktedonobacterales bacterium]
MIEQLRIGARVFSSDGKQIGALSRVVVSRAELMVTALVVDPGPHLSELLEPGGLDKSRDRTVPVALAREVTDDGITLNCDPAAFARLPLFERREYVDTPVEAGHSRFRVGELVNYLASAFGLGAAPYVPDTEEITLDLAPGSDALPDDAPIWRNTPREEIGVVERTLADAATQRVTGLVMRRHSIDDRLVVVPASVITSVEDGVAHVELTDEQLDHLPLYEDED